jgi:hypothetical protein
MVVTVGWDDRGLPAPLCLLQKLAFVPTKPLQESVEPLQEAHSVNWLVRAPYGNKVGLMKLATLVGQELSLV